MFDFVRQAYERLRWLMFKPGLDSGSDMIMSRYRARGIVKNAEDAKALHMFFSPQRVPPGLSEDQARLCIALYPRREQQVKQAAGRSKFLFSVPPLLPEELWPTGWMTRSRFHAGMRKFMAVA